MNFRDLIANEGLPSVGNDVLAEAKFSEKNIEKVVKLYSKIMGKRLGGTFRPLGFETYTRKWGPGKGFRTMNDAGAMLRFNWDFKMAKAELYELTSMDYWAPKNHDFQRPTRTVKFAPELNVIQVLDKVTDALKSGSIREANDVLVDTNVMLSERTAAERMDWAEQNGLARSVGKSPKYLRQRADAAGLSEQLEVFMGAKETNSFEGELKQVKKQFNAQVYANPETVFGDIEDLLSLVAAGKWRTLIICGQGGIGKTYGVVDGPRGLKKLLGAEGGKWTYHSGTKASPLAFYKTLFQERDKIIVFDEADAILKNSEIVMMLKPILDTSGDNLAEYITNTANMVGKSSTEIEAYAKYVDAEIEDGKIIGKKDTDAMVMLPSKFKFEGGMIFISNMKASEIEPAIMSRSIFVDVYLAQSDVLKRIQTIGYAIADNDRGEVKTSREDIDIILEVLGSAVDAAPAEDITYMTPEYARKSKQVTVRAMQLAIILKNSGLGRWKELAALYA